MTHAKPWRYTGNGSACVLTATSGTRGVSVMSAITKLLAGGIAIATLAGAAPAAAQYYPGYGPGYGYGNPYGGNVVGQVLNSVLGNGYGANSQVAVNQCAAAVQQRLSGGYGYNGYGNAGGRVLGISRVEPRSNGEL